MKILVVGGTGTIGRAVVSELKSHHEIIVAGFSSGDVQVDISNSSSIHNMYETVGKLDAVVSTTGKVEFADLSDMTSEKYQVGLQNKLMGQVNLALLGLDYLNDNGSITLTSGILNRDPIRMGSSAAMVNGAIDGFVKSAAIEMPRGIRINTVSPTVITEAMDVYADFFRGFEPVSASKAALAYSKSVEGLLTGEVLMVSAT